NLDRYTPYISPVPVVHFPLIDGPGNPPEDVAHIVQRLGAMVEEGKVLVHCAAGVSRSPYVVALYFAWKHNVSFEEALARVARRRSRNLNVDAGLLSLTESVLGLLSERR
ncbi:MAG: dual specificity protein phosphatase family protein, partial [Chloroflexi bacterium]|nr:dual specificity protein phosphatase family protein [Chloroflexota bacterium]